MGYRDSLVAALMMLGIFAVDILTPVGMAEWLLYVLPLFFVSRAGRRPQLVLFLLLGTALIIAGLFASPDGVRTSIGVFNRINIIIILWILSFFLMSRKRDETALKESEERFRMLFESMTEGFALGEVDYADDGSPRDFRFLEINAAFERLTGLRRADIVGMPITRALPHLERYWIDSYGRVALTGEPARFENYNKDTDRRYDVFAYRPSPGRFAIIFTDITERKRTEEALKESEERFRRLADAMPQLVWTATPDGVVDYYNKRVEEFEGFERLPDGSWRWEPVLHPADREPTLRIWRHALATGATYEIEHRVLKRDGTYHWYLSRGEPVRDRNNRIVKWYGTATDIDALKRLEEEIKHQAHHDALTGLPNRRLFMDMLALELAKALRSGDKIAVLFLDLDKFKYINDTLGHDIGDELLKAVAERLKRSVRRSDAVARIGGDEFNILLTDITHAEDAARTARAIADAFRAPFVVGAHDLHVGTSVGISLYPDDAGSVEALFRNADIAMYHAKEQGGSAYQFYDASMNTRTIERLRFESWLRESLSRDELEVYYQPQIDLATKRVVCAEALVRWRHPERGLLEPQHFIPIAEETGFITAIDEWVLRTACAQARQWQQAGLPPLCVTVNLSAKQFQKADLAERVAEILRETGFDPARLDLEITESTAMKNVEHTIPHMTRLAAMGVGIAIDDFGTGYSSLNYLKKLPIHKLKIDKSFVQDLATDADDRTIVKAVTALAQNMKLRVIAEGVETEEQAEFLKSVGCKEMQGFLFSRPLPAEEFEALIADGG